jgi:hypothetical protein
MTETQQNIKNKTKQTNKQNPMFMKKFTSTNKLGEQGDLFPVFLQNLV